MKPILPYIIFYSCLCLCTHAQDQNGIKLIGNIQSGMLIPQEDKRTGAEKTEDFQTNTYADLIIQTKNIDAGARLEFLGHPLPGYEKDFKGWGVPNFWVKARTGQAELTAGTFYEQFGSGLILRAYEDRSIGIDNSLLGGKVVIKPIKGVSLKALAGRQRHYWKWNKGLVSGADVELGINEWTPFLSKHNTMLTIGGSWVNKYEKKEDIFVNPTHKLNLPRYVNAFDLRSSIISGPWNLHVEIARKSQDPSFDNQYSYRHGNATLLSGSFSKNGLSFLLQAKRNKNMSFRSKRSMTGTSSFINHLPPFTQEHTYTLASLYPYSTQLAQGERAWQAEAGYVFKKKTSVGGKYGMNMKMNFSNVRWKGETYYQDFDIQFSRKIQKDFKLTVMYMNQRYNKKVVEGHGEMVRSNIFIADGKYKISPKTTIRAELQYLATHDDERDWTFILAELALAPHWMFSVSDLYNIGETDIHYYQGGVTFSASAHRLQISYGRTRPGYNCSGGVCRYVPASRGISVAYNYSF